MAPNDSDKDLHPLEKTVSLDGTMCLTPNEQGRAGERPATPFGDGRPASQPPAVHPSFARALRPQGPIPPSPLAPPVAPPQSAPLGPAPVPPVPPAPSSAPESAGPRSEEIASAPPEVSTGGVSPWAKGRMALEKRDERRQRDEVPDSERIHEVALAQAAQEAPTSSPAATSEATPPAMLGPLAGLAVAPPSGLDEAPEEDRTYATPRARMHARQLAQVMTTENSELDLWVRRNVASESTLGRADIVRMRDILLFLSEALRTGDREARLRILDMWDASRRPDVSSGAPSTKGSPEGSKS